MNGNVVSDKTFAFSFVCFDRTEPYFNLGDDSKKEKIVDSHWFLSFLDCLKDVSHKTIVDLQKSKHDLHRVDFKNTNVKEPNCNSQLEYWQFRIDKSHGRVIGFKIDNVFYVVWLDPHHNLTNSESYGTATEHYAGKSTYEIQKDRIKELESEVKQLEEDVNELLVK